MKNRKSKLLILALVIATVLCTAFAVMTSASETEKTPEIISKNIQYGEKYSIMYAVDANSVAEGDVTLKVYTQYPNVEDGKTFTCVSKAPETITVGGKDVSAYVFITGGIPAQDFADKFYAQAFDSKGNASEVVTYSVVEYMLERLYGGYNISEVQEELYTTALAFGAASQKRFSPDDQYKVNDYKYVRVVGGTANGVTKGMFFANTALTLNANVPEGYILSGWNVTVNGETTTINTNELTLKDNSIVEAVFEEIKSSVFYDFEDGVIPSYITADLKTAGAALRIDEIDRADDNMNALVLKTCTGNADTVKFTKANMQKSYRAVFESEIYMSYAPEATSKNFIISLYDKNGNMAYYAVFSMNGNYYQFYDYSDQNSVTGRIVTGAHKTEATPEDWFTLRIEYVYGDSSTVSINTYVNDKLIVASNNFYGKRDNSNAPQPCTEIGRVDISSYGGNASEMYFDNVFFGEKEAPVLTNDFEGLTELPANVQAVVGDTAAQIGIIKDDTGNNSDVLQFYMNQNRASALKINRNFQLGANNAYVFETDINVSFVSEASSQFYIYLKNDDTTIYALNFALLSGSKTMKIKDFSADSNAVNGAEVLCPASEWFNLKVEYYVAANKQDVRFKTYINDNLVYVSDNYFVAGASKLGEIDYAFIQCYSTAKIDLRFDNTALYGTNLTNNNESLGVVGDFENAYVDTVKKYYVHGTSVYSFMGYHSGAAFNVETEENGNKYLYAHHLKNTSNKELIIARSTTKQSYNGVAFDSDIAVNVEAGGSLDAKFRWDSSTSNVVTLLTFKADANGAITLVFGDKSYALNKNAGDWFNLRIELVEPQGVRTLRVYVDGEVVISDTNVLSNVDFAKWNNFFFTSDNEYTVKLDNTSFGHTSVSK